MITQKRSQPLSAEVAELETGLVPVATHTLAADEQVERDQRFADGVRTLRVGGASVVFSERILLVLGGIIAPLGLVVVLLGWWGASHTGVLFEQIPYLISGGLFGLGLVFLGSFFYFAHWLTQLVKEHRVQSVAVVEALQRLQDQVAKLGEGQVAVGTNGLDADTAVALVATGKGSMAHRPDCVVVSGKTGLRTVEATDGLTACKLCEPY